MITALIAVAAFTLAVVYNYVAAVGIRDCAAGHAHRAALADAALYVMGVASIASLVLIGWWLAVPELLGGYLGTFYGTRRVC